MRVTVPGLLPNKHYSYQARVTGGELVSPWSTVFSFDTSKDILPPGPVTNLVGVSNNAAFKFTWNAPTTNADGTALTDLKGYLVVVTSALGTTSRTVRVTSPEYSLTAEDVTSIFFQYVNTITLTVQAEDWAGNLSTPVSATAQKAKPNPVTGLTWTALATSFVATWVAPTQDTAGNNLTNLKDYEIAITAGAYTRYFYSTTTNFEFSLELNKKTFVESGLFTTPQGNLTISVAARDTFNETSTTVSLTAQNAPPAVPTGLAGTAGQDQIALKWNAVADTDLLGYQIWVGNTNVLGNATKAWSGDATSYLHSTVAYSLDHYFWVTAVDGFGQTNFSASVGPFRPTSGFGVDNTPPAVPTGLTGTSAVDPNNPYGTGAYIDASWTANAAGDGVAGYRLRVSQSSSGPWDYMDLPGEATSARINFLQPNKTYYIGVQAYDAASNRSAFSANYTQLTGKDTSLPANPGTVSITGYPSSFVATWPENTEIDVAGGKGYYEFTYSTSATFASGNVVRNVTSGIASVTGLAQGVPYYVRVRTFDASGNASTGYSTASITLGSPASYTSDGVAPTSSPTPVVNPLYQALEVKWSPVTNADPVTYEVHVSTTSGFTPGAGTKSLEVAGTFAIIKTLPGTSTGLTYSTTYYVKIIAKDRDGSAAAGTQASAVTLQVDNGDIATNAVRANNVQAGAITTDKLTVGFSNTQIKNPGLEDYVNVNPGDGSWAPTSWVKPSYEIQSWSPVTGASSIAGAVSWLSTTVQPTTGGVEASFLTKDYYPVTPGDKWFLNAIVKSGTAVTQGMYFEFWWYDSTKTFLSASTAYSGGLTGAVQTINGTVTVPTGVSYLVINASFYQPNVATTITFGEVNAGRVVSSVQIADGGITADKLSIGGTTSTSPVLNGGFEDPGNGSIGSIAANWTDYSNGTGNPGGTGIRTTAAAYSGLYGIQMGTAGNPYLQSPFFALSPGEQLSMAATSKLVSGVGGLYLRLSFRNSAGAEIGISDSITPPTVPAQPNNYAVTSTWGTFGTQTVPAPAGTVAGVIQVYNTNGTIYVDNVDVRRLATGTTIADGAITTNKMTANSINASVITTGTLNGDRLIGNTVDAGVLKANTTFTQALTVSNIFTLGTSAGGPGYIKSYNYDGVSTGFQLSSSGLDVQSGTIQARALVIQDSANIVPAPWAGFSYRPSYYNLTQVNNSGGTTTATIDTTYVKYGSASVKVATSAGMADGYVYLANDSSSNIPVEPNTTYIASIWCYHDMGLGQTVNTELYVRFSSNGNHYANPSANIPNAKWTQIFFTFTTDVSTFVTARVDNNTPSSRVWFNGLQIEKKIAALDTPSPWTAPGNTSIDGAIIRTGSIQSNQPSSIDSSQPMWAINMAGNLSVNDAQIRGKIVVGSNGYSANNSVSIASWNYGAGVANSWAIKGDGTFSIQGAGGSTTLDSTGLYGNGFSLTNSGLTVSGTVNAYSGTIGPGDLVMNGGSIKSNSNGGTSNVILNSNGLYAYNSYSYNTAYINSAGSLFAMQGQVGGWYLNSTTLYSSNTSYGYPMTMDASLGFVGAGSGTNFVGMQAGVGIWLGNTTSSSAPFYVNMSGALSATNATVAGTFVASNAYGKVGIGPSITYNQYPALIFTTPNGDYSIANGIVQPTSGRVQLVGGTLYNNAFIDLDGNNNQILIGRNTSNNTPGNLLISVSTTFSAPVAINGSNGLNVASGAITTTGTVYGGFMVSPYFRGPANIGTVVFDQASDHYFQNTFGAIKIFGSGSATVYGEFFTSATTGNVRIGIGNASANATTIGDAGAAVLFQRNNGTAVGGSTYVAIKCQTVIQNSTESTKRNIKVHDYGLETLKKLRSVKYERAGRQNLGFVANEIAAVMPEAVHYEPNDAEEFGNEPGALMGVDLGAMISLLMKSSQELADENQALRKRLDALEKSK